MAAVVTQLRVLLPAPHTGPIDLQRGKLSCPQVANDCMQITCAVEFASPRAELYGSREDQIIVYPCLSLSQVFACNAMAHMVGCHPRLHPACRPFSRALPAPIAARRVLSTGNRPRRLLLVVSWTSGAFSRISQHCMCDDYQTLPGVVTALAAE